MNEQPQPDQQPNVAGQAAQESNVAGQAAQQSNVAGQAAQQPNVAGQATPDPWKSFRGVMAGTLILEAIVVLLALPVVAAADHGLTPLSAGYLIGFAVVLVLLGGVQGRPWAIWVNLGIQVVLIAGWLVHGAVGFIGVIFTVVWVLIAYLRAEVLRRQKRGLLPGQQSPPH
ncbi:MAG: hypothetical protein JWR48_6190 [Mycobacterium sp.]|nr:hypothetical protein [Mycobacterium sp.]